MCGSTCFGRLPAHHQEHTTALGASGFTVGGKRLQPLLSNGKTMCGSTCFGRLPAHHQEHTTALGASSFTVGEKRLELLVMGGETPETCWATHKRQVINLWNCCILLVELFQSYDESRTYERRTSYLIYFHLHASVGIMFIVSFYTLR